MRIQKPLQFIFCLLISLLLNSQTAHAQSANIRGFVYEKGSGEPVIFTNVYLLGTAIGATTDVNGYFSITKVPAGNYTLTVTYIGCDTLKLPIEVKGSEIITKKLFLAKSSVKLRDVVISAEKQEAVTTVRTSVTKITAKEIKQLPSVGGEPDLAQYLQVIPGVVFTGDQGGQLYIRGGSPIQNKVLMDGMIVYNPFHSIGLFSVFDADIIRNADVYTGGFGAQYAGRISSIMDITTRDGNKKRLAGKVSATTFGAKVLLEGPLVKQKEDGGGSSSFLVSLKNSYLNQTSKSLYSYIDSNGLPYRFTDLYAKISINGSNGSKFNVFGFNFNDKVNYRQVSDLHWAESGAGSNFVLIPNNSSVLVKGNFAYSKYGISLTQADQQERKSDINGFNLGLDFTYFYGKNDLTYGVEILGYRTNFVFYNSLNRKLSQLDNTTEIGGFIKSKLVFGKLLVEPSFRLHYYASLPVFSPEPRLGLKFNASDKFRIKFAGGMYTQNLMSAASDRDVVNLFYGFLSSPDNLQDEFLQENGNTKAVKNGLQRANHVILGFEGDIKSHLTLNIEGYYKQFGQLTNINKNKIFDDDVTTSDKPDVQKKDYIVESGDAEGVDISLKYDKKRLYLWAVYSLTFVNRWDGIYAYQPHFDRRHNVNLVGTYTFGKGLHWEFDARWNLGSGFPFYKTTGFYEKLYFQDGVNTDYTTENGDLSFQLEPTNTGRLPYYHRLDISIKRKFEVGTNATLEANAGITNVYNRKNIFYQDRITNQRVNQLPFLPSLGVNLVF